MFSFILLCRGGLWWPYGDLYVLALAQEIEKRSASNQWVWGVDLWFIQSTCWMCNNASVGQCVCGGVNRNIQQTKVSFPTHFSSRLFRHILAHNDFLDFVQAAAKQILLNFLDHLLAHKTLKLLCWNTHFAGCICPFHTSEGVTEVTDHYDSNWMFDCCGCAASGKRGGKQLF